MVLSPANIPIPRLVHLLSVNYLKEFNKVITYKGRLDLFSNYKHNPQNVDLYFTNVLNIKLSKILCTDL